MSRIGIVFIHGSGDQGESFRQWIQIHPTFLDFFEQNGAIYRFPSAPLRRYSLQGGEKCHVWHDRVELSLNAEEDLFGIDQSIRQIEENIDSLIRENIPLESIFVFGMSMGGHMALQILNRSRYGSSLAGIIALSCFLSSNSPIWDDLVRRKCADERMPPIMMAHGTKDYLIPYDWGLATSNRLKEVGFDLSFTTIQGMGHDIVRDELEIIKCWIDSRIKKKLVK